MNLMVLLRFCWAQPTGVYKKVQLTHFIDWAGYNIIRFCIAGNGQRK